MLKSNQGTSLLEIMVAMTVFTTGVTLAMRTLPESNSATTVSRNMATATNMAQEKLEELLNLEYENADLNDGTHNDPGNPIDEHFTRTWSVVANSPVTNMKTVQVTVAYPPGGANDEVTLTTTITNGR
jgi:Tfp pilus assembly protein PilV